jgi:dolichol-phosphate mannosyltransferase
MPESLVVLPKLVERELLPSFLEQIFRLDAVDVLVIDDAPLGSSSAVTEGLAESCARLSVVHRREAAGLGSAWVHGLREALARGYERVVTMDSSLSHAPQDVPRLLEALDRADVAIGSRFAPGGSVENRGFGRGVSSRLGNSGAGLLLGFPVRDATSGFRAYRSSALRAVDLDGIRARGFVVQVELLHRILEDPLRRAVEVPIRFRARDDERSLPALEDSTEATRRVISLTGARALRGIHATLGRRLDASGADRCPPRVSNVADRVSSRESSGVRVDPRASSRVVAIVPTLPAAPLPRCVARETGSAAAATSSRSDGSASSSRRPLAARIAADVIVARGRAPSRQRNLAVAASASEYILFLDDDSRPSEGLVARYAALLDEYPGVAAVGGPALAEPPRTAFESMAASVLSESWVLGRSASRYRVRGALRASDERELILCNLCVRRSSFEAAGGFDTELYPNEENALLERLKSMGERLVYDPGAVVHRTHRTSLGEHLRAIHRYGRGRAAQLRVFPSRTSVVRVVGIAAIGVCASVVLGVQGLSGALALALFLAAYGSALALRSVFRRELASGNGLGPDIRVAGVGLSSLAAYATGVLRGLFERPTSHVAEPIVLERFPRNGPAESAVKACRPESFSRTRSPRVKTAGTWSRPELDLSVCDRIEFIVEQPS